MALVRGASRLRVCSIIIMCIALLPFIIVLISLTGYFQTGLFTLDGGFQGSWGSAEYCPFPHSVNEMQLKIQGNVWGDDSALNGIQLTCTDGTTIHSSVGSYGTWRGTHSCPHGSLIKSAKIRADHAFSHDNTAANGIMFKCTDLTEHSPGDGLWGSWSSWKSCPQGSHINGMITQIDNGGSDITGLNDVTFFCTQVKTGNVVSATMPTEKDGTPVKNSEYKTFENWGDTVKNTPVFTFYPMSKVGISNIVKWAIEVNKTVRVNGYKHTWTNLYSSDDQVLISMIPQKHDELREIQIVGDIVEDGQRKKLCKIGAAATNEEFRKWVIDNSYDKDKKTWKPWWTLPLNVIMVEITFGGVVSMPCHGAGWNHKTVSDLVRSIEFVNPLGNLQVVNDPKQLKAAAGSFGMLGVLTSITLVLDPLTFVEMTPVKQHVGLAIPPPVGFELPDNIDMEGITDIKKKEALEEFVDRCENDYYA